MLVTVPSQEAVYVLEVQTYVSYCPFPRGLCQLLSLRKRQQRCRLMLVTVPSQEAVNVLEVQTSVNFIHFFGENALCVVRSELLRLCDFFLYLIVYLLLSTSSILLLLFSSVSLPSTAAGSSDLRGKVGSSYSQAVCTSSLSSRFSFYLLPLCLCLILFLMYPCVSVWDNIRA